MPDWLQAAISFFKSIGPAFGWGVRVMFRTFRLVGSEHSFATKAVPLVHIQPDRHELTKDEPRLVFVVTAYNATLSEIALFDWGGEIHFADNFLAGDFLAEMTDVSLRSVPRLKFFHFRIIQRLSKETAARILATPRSDNQHITFGFNRVRVLFVTKEEGKKPNPVPFEVRLPARVQVDAGTTHWTIDQQPQIFIPQEDE